MKRSSIFFVCLLLGGAFAELNGKPISIMTYHYGKPGPAANWSKILDDALGKMLDSALACADVRSIDDIALVLDNMRQRQLLGSDIPDDQLSSLTGAFGANYIVTTRVTMMGTSVVATSSVIDVKTARTVARKNDNLGSGDDALDAVDSFFQNLLDDLRGIPDFSDEKCPPPDDWIGTVSIRGERDDKQETPWGVAGVADEGKGTETLTRHTIYTAEIRITRSAQTAQVNLSDTMRSEKVLDGRKRCWKSNNPDDWVWKDVHHSILEVIESSANGSSPEGHVGVSVADGKIKIDISLPAVPGKSKVTDKVVYAGGCSPQPGVDETREANWDGQGENIIVEAPAGSNARSQDGSWTAPPNPYDPGAKTTITWKLTWSKRSLKIP